MYIKKQNAALTWLGARTSLLLTQLGHHYCLLRQQFPLPSPQPRERSQETSLRLWRLVSFQEDAKRHYEE